MNTFAGTKTILVAEDEPEVRSYLEMALRCQGYLVESAEDGEEVLSSLFTAHRNISLVLLDLMLPRKDGLETLREIRRVDGNLPIIVLSGATSPIHIVEAMKSGATDFIGKPVSHGDLAAAIHKALQVPGCPVSVPAERWGASATNERFMARNGQMKKIEAALKRIAASDVPVLLEGESGVGKEVLARQLHAESPRAKEPFLKLNCASLPAELLESELFGYERGAFTGAFKNKPGKFELADGGTILLDEIGDMDFRLQAKLLQVLQDHEFQRLGGKDTIRVDVRVLAATHCDLEKAMEEGRFREDLYYRLNVIAIKVPPLRERRDEILSLASFFLNKHGAATAKAPEITPTLKQALLAHTWPGNIRELENVMRKFLVFRDADAVAGELGTSRRRKQIEGPETVALFSRPVTTDLPASSVPELAHVSRAAEQAEAEAISSALSTTRWNRKEAAALLGMPYKALLYKMKKLSIDRVGMIVQPGSPARSPAFEVAMPALDRMNETRRQAEAEAILRALNSMRWNRKKAAAVLNIDYKALLYKMKKLGIDRMNSPDGASETEAKTSWSPGTHQRWPEYRTGAN